MSDMDLDDLDGPIKAPTRTTRFAPKNSKLKPQPPPKPIQNPEKPPSSSEPPPPPETQDSDSVPSKKKEELDSEVAAAKSEFEPPNDTVKMDHQEPQAESMEVDQGKDYVVREIDVFLSPSIDTNTQLYVLQYPLRPSWRPYELDDRCEEVRVKPESAEVEVDLSIDFDSQNYDPESDLTEKMTKQTLSSTWKPPRASGYAVGVLIGNKLHLNPIRAVVQLRPCMDYLRSGGSKKKNNVSTNGESTIKSEKHQGQTHVDPSKKQNKPPGSLAEQNKDIGEQWVPLKYHSSKSDFAARYLRKMDTEDSSPIQFSMSPGDYVNSMCPGAANENSRPKGLSIGSLLSLPLEERFKTWLREGAPVNRFDRLMHLAPNESKEDVLRILQKYAQLVQGLWVPKSSLLYEGGQGAEVLARDYILLLFTKNPVVSYEKVNVSGALGKYMKAVLSVLAVDRDSCRDWKLKETPDMSFIKLHPDIVREQEQAWERVEEPITRSIFGGGKSGSGIKNSSKPDMNNRLSAKSKNSNKGEGKSSNVPPFSMPMSEETREALPKALQKVFLAHKVCSLKLICQRLREMAVSESNRMKGVPREAIAAANAVDAPQEHLVEIISQLAINIHGVYVWKSSLEHPEYNDFRKVVINLLIAGGPSAKLKRASIVEAAKMQLKRDVPSVEFQKVLSEICVSQGSAWVLKSGDRNL